MLRAILDGLKTQTRRAIKPQPELTDGSGFKWKGELFGENSDLDGTCRNFTKYACKLGQPGDRLWVKETSIITPKYWNDGFMCLHTDNEGDPRMVQYIATHPDTESADQYGLKKTPSILMPRWASRILLEITNVRAERLNDISEADAVAEGITQYVIDTRSGDYVNDSYAIDDFRHLWQSINGQGSWDLNPWVWVIEFSRIISK